ncbi:hypothetical protein ABZ896_16765 [Streptomyces sp. NPDC047072]|uniref:hypothetical protein n=1 Tax=Streptomyces sp. NPDC047072 TaxID=3154809 RepID=UPI0033E86457
MRTVRRLGQVHLAQTTGTESTQDPVRPDPPRIRPAQPPHPELPLLDPAEASV